MQLIHSQATQTLLTRVPETTSEEFEQAVDAASHAFRSWRQSSVLTRQRFVMEYVKNVLYARLCTENIPQIAVPIETAR